MPIEFDLFGDGQVLFGSSNNQDDFFGDIKEVNFILVTLLYLGAYDNFFHKFYRFM
jgi:hypothetical protein